MACDMSRQVEDLFRRDHIIALRRGRSVGHLLCLLPRLAFQPSRGLLGFGWISDVVVPLLRSVNEPEDEALGVKLVLLVRARC